MRRTGPGGRPVARVVRAAAVSAAAVAAVAACGAPASSTAQPGVASTSTGGDSPAAAVSPSPTAVPTARNEPSLPPGTPSSPSSGAPSSGSSAGAPSAGAPSAGAPSAAAVACAKALPLTGADGPRLTSDAAAAVTGAWVCRGGTAVPATPAQARALAAALALPQPPHTRAACSDLVRLDTPSWVLRTSDGSLVRPAAPTDSCGKPVREVQQAIAAVLAAD